MILTKEYAPQYREADNDGLIGMKGYLNYFQDMAGLFIHQIGKGNDVLRKDYHTFWMYTKYKMHMEKKADFKQCLHMETCVKKTKHSAVLNQELLITREGETYAHGELESCFFNLDQERLVRPSFVDFPAGIEEEKDIEQRPFYKFPKNVQNMEYCYSYVVRYTDLDGNHHMTNLHYINLLLDSCDSQFYEEHQLTDLEIHFVNQSYEKERLKVYKREEEDKIFVEVRSEEEQLIVQGIMITKRKEM